MVRFWYAGELGVKFREIKKADGVLKLTPEKMFEIDEESFGKFKASPVGRHLMRRKIILEKPEKEGEKKAEAAPQPEPQKVEAAPEVAAPRVRARRTHKADIDV